MCPMMRLILFASASLFLSHTHFSIAVYFTLAIYFAIIIFIFFLSLSRSPSAVVMTNILTFNDVIKRWVLHIRMRKVTFSLINFHVNVFYCCYRAIQFPQMLNMKLLNLKMKHNNKK